MTYCKCGKPTKYNYKLCWKCYTQDQITAARADGFTAGMLAGGDNNAMKEAPGAAELKGYKNGFEAGKHSANAQAHAYRNGSQHYSSAALDIERIRKLIQLCHPDKHGGSPAANEATQWLLGMKDKL